MEHSKTLLNNYKVLCDGSKPVKKLTLLLFKYMNTGIMFCTKLFPRWTMVSNAAHELPRNVPANTCKVVYSAYILLNSSDLGLDIKREKNANMKDNTKHEGQHQA